MKRLWTIMMGVVLVTVLAACGTTKEQDAAAVEDRTKPVPGDVAEARPTPKVKPDTTTRPFVEKPVAVDPLKDPGSILSRRSIFFDYDSNLVRDEFKPVVSAHARYLQQHPGTKMRVEGNADERGSREYNLALGQRRAEAVKQMMQLLGARPDQIESVSYGEEKPRCTESAESCWSQNRRGDIVYQGE